MRSGGRPGARWRGGRRPSSNARASSGSTNPANLRREERTRLSALLRLNSPIVRAYLLKEDLRRFWAIGAPPGRRRHLRQWLWRASHSRLGPFQKLAHTLRAHLDGVLAWTRIRVTNGALEGMNNKVKAISHRAFGYRPLGRTSRTSTTAARVSRSHDTFGRRARKHSDHLRFGSARRCRRSGSTSRRARTSGARRGGRRGRLGGADAADEVQADEDQTDQGG